GTRNSELPSRKYGGRRWYLGTVLTNKVIASLRYISEALAIICKVNENGRTAVYGIVRTVVWEVS
ncbi:MAG: hypothetical protein LBH37_00720, partial [Oscillospiraceae bacterium]|nr:hypothetical protein [Oscillospiraceae bacterium]